MKNKLRIITKYAAILLMFAGGRLSAASLDKVNSPNIEAKFSNFWELTAPLGVGHALPYLFDTGTYVACENNFLVISPLNTPPIFTPYGCPYAVYTANNQGILTLYNDGIWMVPYYTQAVKVGVTPSSIYCASSQSQAIAQYGEQVWLSTLNAYYQFSNELPGVIYGCTAKGFIGYFNAGLFSLNFDGSANRMSSAYPSTIYGTNSLGAVGCFGNGMYMTRYDGNYNFLTAACPSYASYVDETRIIACFGNGTYSITWDGSFTQLSTSCPKVKPQFTAIEALAQAKK